MQDFWKSIFLAALNGQHDRAHLAIQSLPGTTPARHHPRLAAISARALFAMGEPERAKRQLEWGARDAEGAALCSLIATYPPRPIARRVNTTNAGMAADAACDLAWARLQRSDHAGAVDAVSQARALCPQHVEARLWVRLLHDSGVDALRRALFPTAEQGWLSWERIARRPHGSVWKPGPDSALERLQAGGIPLPQLTSKATYSTLPGDHPQVTLEVMLDEATALHRMGYPGGALLKSLWMRGQTHPPAVIRQLARVVIDLAVFDPSAARVGLAAASVMAERTDCLTLASRKVRLQAMLKTPGTLRAARRLLHRVEEPDDWTLVVDSIHRLGHHSEARAEAERQLGLGSFTAAAQAMLMSWTGRTG